MFIISTLSSLFCRFDFYVCIKEFLEIFGLQNENLINSEEIDAVVWETKLVNTDLKDL